MIKIKKEKKSLDINNTDNKNNDKVIRKKTLGYLLVIIGILIPLFSFTSISVNNLTEKQEYKEFIDKKRLIGNKDLVRIEKNINRYNYSLNNNGYLAVDPFSSEEYKTNYNIMKNNNDIFAYIRIPKIKVLKPIRLDASYEHLAKGVAHVDGTSLPVGGESTRSVIAGHRGWYRDVMFLHVGELKNGDMVYIDNLNNTLEYKVISREIISPSEWEKLNPIQGKDMLTLLSCDPIRPPSPYRILINCERVYTSSEKSNMINNKADANILKENEPEKNKKNTSYEVSTKVKIIDIIIYLVTIFGWFLVAYNIYKLYLNIKKNK